MRTYAQTLQCLWKKPGPTVACWLAEWTESSRFNDRYWLKEVRWRRIVQDITVLWPSPGHLHTTSTIRRRKTGERTVSPATASTWEQTQLCAYKSAAMTLLHHVKVPRRDLATVFYPSLLGIALGLCNQGPQCWGEIKCYKTQLKTSREGNINGK